VPPVSSALQRKQIAVKSRNENAGRNAMAEDPVEYLGIRRERGRLGGFLGGHDEAAGKRRRRRAGWGIFLPGGGLCGFGSEQIDKKCGGGRDGWARLLFFYAFFFSGYFGCLVRVESV
jgi:hypothetical protein